MINLALLRENPVDIATLIARKDSRFNTAELIALDANVRTLRFDVESLRNKKNVYANQAKLGVNEQLREQSIALSEVIKKKEQELIELEEQFNCLLLSCPNILHKDVPEGGPEHNQLVRSFKEKPTWSFEPKNHLELCEKLGWLDFECAAKMTASNFALYRKDAVRLLYALGLFMLKHNVEHGFDPVLPPFLVNEESLIVSGNFPKFKEQAYAIPNDELYLTPTSEVNLINMYRGSLLLKEHLPIRMTAQTSCFRREAGGYGAHERGLIRMHQFEKVELVTICEPSKSLDELDKMISCAESILKKLNLHYRIMLLAGKDTGFQAAKTYDIEVWLPGQKEYREVSSASTCDDFQARRGKIRYKTTLKEKATFVHTLNASSLAIPRLMVALIETYQQADGSIALPELLQQLYLW